MTPFQNKNNFLGSTRSLSDGRLSAIIDASIEIPINHVCSCQEPYIGETVRNGEIRWQEHEDTQKGSEPVKHLKNNPTHSFTWKVLLPASSIRHIRQNMEASMVALKPPSLKERVESKKSLLFRNGVT